VLLVVSNFDAHAVEASVVIPQHAFDFLKLRQRAAVEAHDLLTGKACQIALKAEAPLALTIPANSALVLKM